MYCLSASLQYIFSTIDGGVSPGFKGKVSGGISSGLTKDMLLGQHSSRVRTEQLGPCTFTQQPPGPLTLALSRHLISHLLHQGCKLLDQTEDGNQQIAGVLRGSSGFLLPTLHFTFAGAVRMWAGCCYKAWRRAWCTL